MGLKTSKQQVPDGRTAELDIDTAQKNWWSRYEAAQQHERDEGVSELYPQYADELSTSLLRNEDQHVTICAVGSYLLINKELNS